MAERGFGDFVLALIDGRDSIASQIHARWRTLHLVERDVCIVAAEQNIAASQQASGRFLDFAQRVLVFVKEVRQVLTPQPDLEPVPRISVTASRPSEVLFGDFVVRDAFDVSHWWVTQHPKDAPTLPD